MYYTWHPTIAKKFKQLSINSDDFFFFGSVLFSILGCVSSIERFIGNVNVYLLNMIKKEITTIFEKKFQY